jgi:hypothetical protein
MRRANAGLTVVRGNPEKVTGELLEIERLTSSSEGGCGKRAEGYLAGSLPYRTHGDNGGDGKTQCGCASCPYPLHRLKS